MVRSEAGSLDPFLWLPLILHTSSRTRDSFTEQAKKGGKKMNIDYLCLKDKNSNLQYDVHFKLLSKTPIFLFLVQGSE